jgi:hypothetical protein
MNLMTKVKKSFLQRYQDFDEKKILLSLEDIYEDQERSRIVNSSVAVQELLMKNNTKNERQATEQASSSSLSFLTQAKIISSILPVNILAELQIPLPVQKAGQSDKVKEHRK